MCGGSAGYHQILAQGSRMQPNFSNGAPKNHLWSYGAPCPPEKNKQELHHFSDSESLCEQAQHKNDVFVYENGHLRRSVWVRII